MRRIVVAFVVAALALTLSACGGGGDAAPDEAAAPETAPAAAPAPANPEDAVPADLSPEEASPYVAFVPEGVTPPASVTERLESDTPFVIAFYDNDQPVTNDQKAIVAKVLKEYRGQVDSLSFDVGRFVTQSSSGRVDVDADLLEDEGARQAVELAEALGVRTTPYIVVVDSSGYITYRGRGLVDDGTLEREVLRVGE